MSHVTSSWAHQYGLPDPAPAAAEITGADVGIPASAARALDAVVLALRFGRERARTARVAVQSGWTAANAHDAVGSLISWSERVEEACHASSLACTELSVAIAKAHGDVEAAYAAADGSIASMGLGASVGAIGVDDMLRIERERSALVWILNAAMSSIAGTLDAAASSAAAAMALDPSSALPPPDADISVGRPAALARLREDLRAPAGRWHRFARAINSALQQARAAGYTAQLLSYDPDDPTDQGGVAIAIGDVTRAASVSVLVPGVGNSPVHIADSLEAASALNLAADGAAGVTGKTATVLWFGYDIPLTWAADDSLSTPYATARGAAQDSVRAIDATEALMGGGSLASFVRVLRPTMSAASNLTLIGHSYGSTTVAQAARYLAEDDGVDDIVLLGSPGVGYGLATADDFHAVSADHVFSLSFPLDPVPAVGDSDVIAALNPVGQIARKWVFGADLGPFGPNPARDSFGANVIATPTNEPAGSALDFGQHALSNYLSGSSLAAIGAVTAARYQQVPVRKPRQ